MKTIQELDCNIEFYGEQLERMANAINYRRRGVCDASHQFVGVYVSDSSYKTVRIDDDLFIETMTAQIARHSARLARLRAVRDAIDCDINYRMASLGERNDN